MCLVSIAALNSLGMYGEVAIASSNQSNFVDITGVGMSTGLLAEMVVQSLVSEMEYQLELLRVVGIVTVYFGTSTSTGQLSRSGPLHSIPPLRKTLDEAVDQSGTAFHSVSSARATEKGGIEVRIN
ncbi:hypothetical protein HD554DRAFT_2040952 [Boletus coccyginus]|nr:hypothetical protein HD554DRAFT_2040952 [Boletus coccyginus]